MACDNLQHITSSSLTDKRVSILIDLHFGERANLVYPTLGSQGIGLLNVTLVKWVFVLGFAEISDAVSDASCHEDSK